MSNEYIVRLVATLPDGTYIIEHPDGRLERRRSESDWARVDALTDEDIEKAVADDPDAAPLDIDWSGAVLVTPAKTAISIRLDDDVVQFFKAGGTGYQTRINAVLRHYMEQKKASGGSLSSVTVIASSSFQRKLESRAVCDDRTCGTGSRLSPG